MGKQLRFGAGIAAASLLAAGCASANAAQSPAAQSPAAQSPAAQSPAAQSPAAPVKVSDGTAHTEPAADARPYGAGDTAFGLNLLGAWCRQDPRQNLLLSPASMSTALGMAYLGARGATAKAMAETLRLPSTTSLAGLKARTQALNSLDGPGVTLDQSNRVWADPSLLTNKSYLNALATAYQAGVARVPLMNHPAQAAQRIDQAISAATKGQIQHLVNAQMLHGLGWVLTDALYLNANWATKFPASETYQQPFTTASGATVSPQFLHGVRYQVGSAGGWTGVTLPYRGGKVKMVALLPPEGEGCAMPSTSTLAAIAATGVPGSIAMPKVKLSSAGSFEELLASLGMGPALGNAADFTGISPQAGHIALVQQDATLRVNEKGTVAAAATAVGVTATAAQVPVGRTITFNRPYLMLITTATGEPLFLVRVVNPMIG
jgi:serpin B